MAYFGANRPCFWCPCDSNPIGMMWSGFDPDTSVWMQNVYSSAAFRVAHVNNLHPLFRLPGFSIRNIWPDYMHCKYMGTDVYSIGSVLLILCFMTDIPGCYTYQDRVRRVWELCLECYRDNRVDAKNRFSNLNARMFTNISGWRRMPQN